MSGTKGRCFPGGNCSTSAFGDGVPDLSCLLELSVKAEGSQCHRQQQDVAPECLFVSPWPSSLAPECARAGKVESGAEMRRGKRDGSGRCPVGDSGWESLGPSSVFGTSALQWWGLQKPATHKQVVSVRGLTAPAWESRSSPSRRTKSPGIGK